MMTVFTGLTTLLIITTIIHPILCGRRKGDSIMKIMNTRHIERRLNASREEKRALLENDLDEGPVDAAGADMYQTPEVSIGFNLGHRRPSNRPMDALLMHYNDTYIPFTPSVSSLPDTDILGDLQAYRGDKLLKSSKNALFVTRKEYLKKDWCKTEPLIQRVREDGCLSRNIMNRFCYGQCNSFYIPKSPKRNRMTQVKRLYNSINELEPEDLTQAAFRSCAFCKPKKLTWITVTLRCPSLVPPLRRKKIQRIKQCKCIAEPLH